jgi:guanylate kinase
MRRFIDFVKTPPLLLVVSGPSGVGKTSICRRVVDDVPDAVYSISATTRPPRPGETHGGEYFFHDEAEFERLQANGELIESATVHGHRYGTPRSFVESQLRAGRVVVLNIDVQGGSQVMSRIPDGVFVFILPPTFESLIERIRGRAADSDEDVARRMKTAPKEMTFAERYQYIVVNDDLEECVRRIQAIIVAERSLRRRCFAPPRNWLDMEER